MNVVPLLGKAMIEKSSRNEISPITVPFGDIKESIGGMVDAVDLSERLCVNWRRTDDDCVVLGSPVLYPKMITKTMMTR